MLSGAEKGVSPIEVELPPLRVVWYNHQVEDSGGAWSPLGR